MHTLIPRERVENIVFTAIVVIVILGSLAVIASMVWPATPSRTVTRLSPTPTLPLDPTLTFTPWPTVTRALPTATITPLAASPTAIVAQISPEPTGTCVPDTSQIQALLQDSFPDYYWGTNYQVSSITEMFFFGVSTGETKRTVVEGTGGKSWTLDLARFYYLHKDGTLDTVWVTLGFVSSEHPDIYNTFNGMHAAGWYSSQEALAKMSIPGQVFYITFPEAFIDQAAVYWDRCRSTVQIIPKAACEAGPSVDPDGSAQFFTTAKHAEEWVAFGFYLSPNSLNQWVDPIPGNVTLPEAKCQ